VVIVTPNRNHLFIARGALAQGFHVLSDKPATASLGYVGTQAPAWDPGLFHLNQALESQSCCDQVKGRLSQYGYDDWAVIEWDAATCIRPFGAFDGIAGVSADVSPNRRILGF
jgi:hypothetical protein